MDIFDIKQPARVRYAYAIPANLVPQNKGVTHLGIYEITTGEELMATKRAGGNPIRLAYELSLEALRFVGTADANGAVTWTPVNTGDGSADRAYAQLHPKVRNLLMSAYNELHSTKEEEVGSFLGSRTADVG